MRCMYLMSFRLFHLLCIFHILAFSIHHVLSISHFPWNALTWYSVACIYYWVLTVLEIDTNQFAQLVWLESDPLYLHSIIGDCCLFWHFYLWPIFHMSIQCTWLCAYANFKLKTTMLNGERRGKNWKGEQWTL